MMAAALGLNGKTAGCGDLVLEGFDKTFY